MIGSPLLLLGDVGQWFLKTTEADAWGLFLSLVVVGIFVKGIIKKIRGFAQEHLENERKIVEHQAQLEDALNPNTPSGISPVLGELRKVRELLEEKKEI